MTARGQATRQTQKKAMHRSLLTLVLIVLWLAAGSASAQVVEYYHLDGLGNVRAVTDASGNVTERHDYLPFGEECTTGPCAANPGVASGQPRRFTGKERDPETGLDYFGARYYRANNGRFTTVDPVVNLKASILNPQRWNRFSYSLNNPIRFNDPDGREVPVVIDNKLYNMGLEGRARGSVAEGNRAFAGLILGTTTVLFGPEMLAAGVIATQACLFSAPCLGAVQETAEGLAGGAPRPAPAVASGAPGVQANRAAGNAFRDELAAQLHQAGKEVETEVYKKTLFGARIIDIEVSEGGKVLGGIETKAGGSRYLPSQRAKDWWLKNVEGYPVNVARDR